MKVQSKYPFLKFWGSELFWILDISFFGISTCTQQGILGLGSKSKQKIHSCFLYTLYIQPESNFMQHLNYFLHETKFVYLEPSDLWCQASTRKNWDFGALGFGFLDYLHVTQNRLYNSEGLSHSPWADPHQWNRETGEEDCTKEKGLPAPHIRECAYEWSTQKREQALEKKGKQRLDSNEITCTSCFLHALAPIHFISPQNNNVRY
jgi:hypothetical protein